MIFKLSNNGLSVVGTRDDGTTISYLIEAEEYQQWLAEGNTPEPEFTEEELAQQVINAKVQEAKQYLQATDHKFYNGYKPKEGEDLATIEAKRDEAREYIRMNEVA